MPKQNVRLDGTRLDAADGDAVTVRVRTPFRVVHAGIAYSGGDELTVKAGDAEYWLAAGWVERVVTPATELVKES